jgi:hypothetical protein
MNARETCRHNIYWADCLECAEKRLLAMFRPLDPKEAWKNARREVRISKILDPDSWDDLLPTHPRFTVEDQIFLHRRCKISTK